MKKTILAVLCVLCGLMSVNATVINYTADNTTIFPNPERGFLTQVTRQAKTSYYAVKGEEDYALKPHANTDKGTLVLVLYYLDEFNHTAKLPDAVFTAFDEDMQILRNYGMKAILRIAYAENSHGSGESESAADAPLDIIQSHLAQYKPYWEKNADVIFTFQAGFVGQYGEWYYTDNFGNHVPTINADCRALLDTALKTIPQNRTLLLRRPMFKQEYLDGVALTEQEAYTGTAKARLGHFNDAFLYHADNMGTYSSNAEKRAKQKAFIAQETLYVPLGGETDITDADQAAEEASRDATVAEMSTMHWTFIKSSYSETVTDMWRANGTFDELNRNMGYRYQLVNATLPEEAEVGATVGISMEIKNVGYAPLYNERHAYLVLKNATDSIAIQLATDPRRWLPNSVTTSIVEEITIPNDVPEGTYDLYLNLPDAYESLAHDPRYSVRFANTGVWDETSGMNALGASIEISKDVAPTPPPTPHIGTTELPGSVDKTNYTACSDDMTMFNNDYFDLGPTDAENTSLWIEWQVDLQYAAEYSVSEVSYCKNGHSFALELYDGSTLVASYTTTDKYWGIGEQDYTQDTKWDLSGVAPKVYTLRVHNVTEWGQPKLKSLSLDCDIPVSSIILPATLNKANVTAYSDDMTWFNTDYFDLGPTDAPNLDRWAEWTVNLKYPGQYIISEVSYCNNGHSFALDLYDGFTIVASYTTEDNHWGEGDQSYTQEEKWDLSAVAKKVYTLRVHNATEWGQPKLKSLTLEYNGEIPADIEESRKDTFDGQAFDILGRPVNASYHGIVIQNGKKRIQ